MNNTIENIKKIRLFLLTQIDKLSEAQLNEIPVGFNNNIIWNLAHLICAQQGICYLRGGQPVIVPGKYIKPFLTNTKPERIISAEEIAEIKQLFIDSIDQFQIDYNNNIFSNYIPSSNIYAVYNIELKSIDDALEFILYHEGYHSGCILSLKKLVCHTFKNPEI